METRAGEEAVVSWLESMRASLEPWPWAYPLVVLAALLLLAWLANLLTKRILLRGLRRIIWHFARRVEGVEPYRLRVIPRLANVVPALVILGGIDWVPGLPSAVVTFVQGACKAWIVLTLALAISHALDLLNHLYERRPDAHRKPIKGYVQVAKIAIFILAGLSIIATLAGVRMLHLVTGLGAATAIVMLVFQDTILSFVASVQISSDGRVRVDDWIEMPSQHADGEVIDIALHTVTVQNWDKTVTTIPTRKLISESFKNWRGMTEAGGRRIKRALFLDQASVRFLDGGERELAEWNAGLGADGELPVNARRITNLGTFRVYVEHYLRQHPQVHQDMTLLVRQLQPRATGIPLEIYCFTNDTAWTAYEGIQSDIFDHLLAILPEFGLRVFQEPGGADFRALLRESPGP
jgi:miniconductance mechanosensitive channel